MSASAAGRVKAIVDELLGSRLADLGERSHTERKLKDLGAAISEVEAFRRSVEAMIGQFSGLRQAPSAPAVAAAPKASPVKKGGGKRRTGHRGPGDFPARQFVLDAVRGSGSKGVRPKDVVEMVVTAAPGRHVRPSALVSTLLSRLKRAGEVRSRAGKWYGA